MKLRDVPSSWGLDRWESMVIIVSSGGGGGGGGGGCR